MATNNRIYYAIHAVGFGDHASFDTYRVASGVQSVGLNTTFNLEQVFQLGQIDLYQNIENIPDVELTVEKVMDDTALIQHLASPGASVGTLAGRYNNSRCYAAISYYNETNNSATGTPLATCAMSGMYVSSINMSMPIDGNFTETVTLVGNDKIWATGGFGGYQHFQPTNDNTGASPSSGSGVQRRQMIQQSGCIWPSGLPGMVSPHYEYTGATRGAYNPYSAGAYGVHMQSVNISVDLGRTELFELGQRGPYHRYADFPTEVTCAIEIVETETSEFVNAASEGSNTDEVTIFVQLLDGTQIDLGAKNRLASITSTGGDTGGGNRTTTYNYSNFNHLSVYHDADPAAMVFPT
jgi:hypothetical protein